MVKILSKKITIICLTIITVTEVIITKDIASFTLWIFYGIYKLMSDE